MLMSFKVIYEMLEDINKSQKNKEDILKKYLKDPIFGKTLRQVLNYMIDEKIDFHIKRINNCIYFDDPIASENQNTDGIFKMLDYLQTLTSDPSIDEISFLEKVSSIDVETVEVVTRILNKTSGSGLTNESIKSILEETQNETLV